MTQPGREKKCQYCYDKGYATVLMAQNGKPILIKNPCRRCAKGKQLAKRPGKKK